MKKVIVIGLDGLEPKITEGMLRAGNLPNLQRILETGGYSRIRTTYPAQTPVAWSTFSTGTNPGGHGIFDFLSRDPKTYLPVMALSKYEQKNAFVSPKVVNNRRGIPFWNLLSEAGISSTIIRLPCTYPPDQIKGRIISGVGVPDLRGGLGTSTYYTSRGGIQAESSEKVVPVTIQDDRISTYLIGPRDPKTRADITFDIRLQINSGNKKVILHSDGVPGQLEMIEGKWSDWLKVKFKAGMFQSIRGMTRFYLRQIEPTFEMYVEPINFDPEAPMFPISSPAEYAAELEARLGSYYTIGMAEDHDGIINGRFDELAYLEQCSIVVRDRRRMMLSELDRFHEGFFFCLYDTPDRLQHMFWRFREPGHPANENGFNPKFSQIIEDHYRELDTIIGKVLKYVDDQTLLIVLSDHGMNSFRRGLNLNTWLYENGFLALKNGVKPGNEENGDFFQNVDWDRTRAYALGLGCIFLNLKGREANGIVKLEDVESEKVAIIKGLSGLRDTERGQVAIRSVVTCEDIYSGPFLAEAPDLIANFSEGYRVSWGTPLGGVPAGLFEDNTKRWGGDHVIDPLLVPGVFFMNRSFSKKEPDLVDMAPTILTALGIKAIPSMEGENILL